MSFIWANSETHRIGGILPNRTSYHLRQYFESFALSEREKVKTITVDLNAGYLNLIPRLSPNAQVIVDRFHIVQMINRVLNQTRIQVMKSLDKRVKRYRFMKSEWKQFLRPMRQLERITPKYHKSVGYYQTTWNLISECLALDNSFRLTYETHQTLLEAIQDRDVKTVSSTLNAYRKLHTNLDTVIATLRRYRRKVLNAVTSTYSNGFLEGIISRIKKIKNTAYGYRNWSNFVNRIRLQMVWFHSTQSRNAV